MEVSQRRRTAPRQRLLAVEEKRVGVCSENLEETEQRRISVCKIQGLGEGVKAREGLETGGRKLKWNEKDLHPSERDMTRLELSEIEFSQLRRVFRMSEGYLVTEENRTQFELLSEGNSPSFRSRISPV